MSSFWRKELKKDICSIVLGPVNDGRNLYCSGIAGLVAMYTATCGE